jgi:outer membrane protein assembly factor BamD (BamD/ComL family)
MRLSSLLLAGALALALSSCVSRPEVTNETSAAELIQWAQEASDKNRYRQSMQYYNLVLERFSYDMEMVCTAEYEIAFIFYKKRKYEDARTRFNALLERYNTQDEGLYPPQFKRLAAIVLDQIDKKDKKNK